MPKKDLTDNPFFNEKNIATIEKAILDNWKIIKKGKLDNNSISYKEISSNLPALRCIVFLENSFSSQAELNILNLVKKFMAFSHVKVILIDDEIVKLSSINSHIRNISQVEHPAKYNKHINFTHIQHMINSTSPEMCFLFSRQAFKTDKLLCFKVKKNEIIFTSEKNTPIESLIAEDTAD